MTLTAATVVKRSDTIIANEIDGEAVMLSIANGKYFGLDGVGTDIWNLVIERPRSIGEICSSLESTYDVDPTTCETEVTAFIGVLVADGSIEVVS